VIAADLKLVAVVHGGPLDRLAVEEDPVEAAIVENAQRPPRLGDDQGVAAGDAGMVEAEVGVGAAADPGPATFDLGAADRPVLLAQDEEAPRPLQLRPRLRQPARRPGGMGQGQFAGAGVGVAVILAGGEDRVATEARAAALGAGRERLGGADRQLAAAVEAEEGAGAGCGSGALGTAGGVAADAVEDRWLLLSRFRPILLLPLPPSNRIAPRWARSAQRSRSTSRASGPSS
jgi:hypothetical protein